MDGFSGVAIHALHIVLICGPAPSVNQSVLSKLSCMREKCDLKSICNVNNLWYHTLVREFETNFVLPSARMSGH